MKIRRGLSDYLLGLTFVMGVVVGVYWVMAHIIGEILRQLLK